MFRFHLFMVCVCVVMCDVGEVFSVTCSIVSALSSHLDGVTTPKYTRN